MGTDSVADPSDKGSRGFWLSVPFQEAADIVMTAHEMEVERMLVQWFKKQASPQA
jgi:hypothetical protein